MASVHLSLTDVSVEFGAQTLFRKVELSVRQGEILVLIGPSGQGKTVLLKLLAGLQRPTAGRVVVEGHDLTDAPNEVLLKMGMLFQKNALFDSLTVAENVAFPLRETTQLTNADISVRVEHFLDQVGLLDSRDLYPDAISGGMQKRLGIARAVALSPSIVLYDDPTAGLDPITSRRIADLIVRLREEQKSTVVAVTNDMARAYQLADRIAMVVDGEVLITGNQAETMAHSDPRVAQFVRGNLIGPLTRNSQ